MRRTASSAARTSVDGRRADRARAVRRRSRGRSILCILDRTAAPVRGPGSVAFRRRCLLSLIIWDSIYRERRTATTRHRRGPRGLHRHAAAPDHRRHRDRHRRDRRLRRRGPADADRLVHQPVLLPAPQHVAGDAGRAHARTAGDPRAGRRRAGHRRDGALRLRAHPRPRHSRKRSRRSSSTAAASSRKSRCSSRCRRRSPSARAARSAPKGRSS